MRLDAWLRKDPSVVERLQVAELLVRGVNEAHARGDLLAGLEPARIEVEGGSCDLSDALQGPVSPNYLAPERAGDAAPTTASDVYAAGAIVWETLVGRPYGPAPSHLAEATTNLPADLCDAVMACLESSPDWRPADLAYVAELASQAATQRGGGTRAAAPKVAAAPRAERPKKAGRPSPTFDGRGREASRSRVPLFAAAALLLAGAGAGYFWMTRDRGLPPAAPAVAAPTATTATPATAPSAGEPATAPSASPLPTAEPTAAAALPAPGPTPAPTPTPRPTATPAPASAATAPARSAEPEPPPSLPVAAAAPPSLAVAPAPVTPPATDAAPAPAAPRERAELATLSPLSVKRPGKVLFDLHGTGLAADLQARVLAVRDSPSGLTVVRQKCSLTLCSVLIELNDSVKPAVYAIVVEDPQGRQSNALTFTVTR